tara:strand:+ start:480 stop:917 length:438 start_codon:yes stop_codon:yes gene_type:complete
MIILNDTEFAEALIGGFGWIIAVFFITNGLYKKYDTVNIALIGGLSWGILWSIRKIGMNIYRYIKNNRNIKNKEFRLPIQNPPVKYVIIAVLTFLLLSMIVLSNMAPGSAKILKRFDGKEIPIIIYFIILGYLVYGSGNVFHLSK